MASFKEQYDRMKRSYAKIGSNSKQKYYEDDLWHFFQDAWHLKDWIKADPEIKMSGDDIERNVSGYDNLMICADIANRTKHAELRHKKRANGTQKPGRKDAKHHNTYIIVSLGGTFYDYIIVDENGKEYEAFELANDIIRDWVDFIETHLKLNIWPRKY